jgi:hypothetical protein
MAHTSRVMRPVFLALLLFLSPPNVWAISLLAEPEVELDSTEATVRWRTDGPSGGKIRWGENEGAPDQTVKGGVAAEHRVKLAGLKPGTRYFFTVGTARETIGKGTFTTKGAAVSESRSPSRGGGGGGKGGALVTPRAPIPAPTALVAPPTRLTWGSMASLQDHFDRHGADFGATTPDDYAAKAWAFREQAVAQRLPMKLDGSTVRVMNLRTLAFAAYNRDGTTKTYFRPRDASYWDRQPGTPVTTPPWVR